MFISTIIACITFVLASAHDEESGGFGLFLNRDRRQAQQCLATDRDAEGPFFVRGAPDRNGQICADNQNLVIHTQILDSCTQQPISAKLYMWQTDLSARYSLVNDGGDESNRFKCRSTHQTGTNGRFQMVTTYPPPYPGRPSHIHVIIESPGYRTLTTQLYFSDDPLRVRCWSCQRESQLVRITQNGGWRVGQLKLYLQSV